MTDGPSFHGVYSDDHSFILAELIQKSMRSAQGSSVASLKIIEDFDREKNFRLYESIQQGPLDLNNARSWDSS